MQDVFSQSMCRVHMKPLSEESFREGEAGLWVPSKGQNQTVAPERDHDQTHVTTIYLIHKNEKRFHTTPLGSTVQPSWFVFLSPITAIEVTHLTAAHLDDETDITEKSGQNE